VISASGETTLTSTSGSIALDGANNDFGTVNASGKDIALADVNSMIFGDVISTGNFAVTVGGSISQTGPLTIGGTSDLQAPNGKIDFGNPGNKFGGLVSFKSPNTIFAGVGAPSNTVEQAIITNTLSAMTPPPVAPLLTSAASPEPTSAVKTGNSAPALSVVGFQVMELSSEPITRNEAAPKDLETIIQQASSAPANPGNMRLFVIDGGIRLPDQENRRALPEVK
jgi:hypothetical protein